MPEKTQIAPQTPTRPPWGIRLLGGVLLTFSVGLVSCQAMWIL
ncbi:hypothetical protein ThimaDRAFT_2090 [Thiocapsa marina 5811]|uniref:Uncharacterized protein n=1 Tax=Thiocapsa marina 5811 TaxID=768671 RepID=F9UB54_9GAMM|nr:hypothetical protein ThimaDRAFT_2090 [Thiocapsa marina 5811]